MTKKVHLILTLFLVIGALSLNAFNAGAERIYVNQSVDISGKGKSWDTAYKELADALKDATLASGDEIWVAAGTYYPKDITGDSEDLRDRTFTIPDNVAVYGGFAGTESDRDSRDWVKNITILSGDIEGDDKTEGVVEPYTDNCYTVVRLDGGTLDGFHITGGYGDREGTTGGGVLTYGGTLINNTIYGNEATGSGGGVYAIGGTLINNTIYGNTATVDGGGVYADGITLTNNTIYDNTATGTGGGVAAIDGTLINNTIYGNTAAAGGGGVYADRATLTNNTIYSNKATTNGGGVRTENTTTLANNILWKNTLEGEGGSGEDLFVGNYSEVEGYHNLIGSIVGVGEEGKYIGTKVQTANPNDPLFVDPDNGDFRLQYESSVVNPAINAGEKSLYENREYPLTDATGRLRISGDKIDIGAHEYQQLTVGDNGILYVNASAEIKDGYSANGSSWGNAARSLADALKYAAISEGKVKQIWVAKGTYYPEDKAAEVDRNNATTTARDRSFVIPAGVEVYGGFAGTEDETFADRDWVTNQTILSGDIGTKDNNADNCYHVVIMALKVGETATLDGFTVTGGNAEGSERIMVNQHYFNQRSGGGVWALGNSTLTNNTIYKNTAKSYCGGVYAEGGTILTHNTIYGNEANYGGGVYAIDNSTLINNTIYDNKATEGGGVCANGNSTLINNAIYGNIANKGGGVWAYSATLTNNTIYKNTASSGGGGVYVFDATLYNNILWENNADSGKDLYVSGNSSGSHNLIGNMDGKALTGDNPLIGDAYDPLFVDPDNGDFRLQEDSPAIDKGDKEAYLTVMDIEAFSDGILDAAGNPRLYGETIDIGAYEYQVADEPEEPEEPAITYHTLTLEVAPGIDLYGLTAGSHQIAEGDHLHLQFLADDRTVAAEDIMLLIDGVDTPFTIPAGADAYFNYILNPITADHTVLIALREYTVTLPEVEGITYNVGAGAHKVAYGAPFSFSLSGDFDPEQLKVYINGVEIQPEGKGQTYTIDRVLGPVEITIDGLATSNASLTQGIRLAITNCELRITNEMPNAVDVSIYTLTGQNVVQLRALRGSRTITLPAGVYIVRAGEQRWKIMVND